MASTLACIGLDVADLDALGTLLESLPAEVVGRTDDDVVTVSYPDPTGARVVISRRDGVPLDLVPSYAADPGALLGEVVVTESGLTRAAVLDDDGRTVTQLLVDLEQHRQALVAADPAPVHASVVALGVEMTVHADAAAFAASDASRIGDEPDASRWAAESFVSYGLVHEGPDAEPTGFLAGTIVHSLSHRHSVSGQEFHTVRVRTVGFEATVCLAASDHPVPPLPGNVVAGSCYLVADVPSLWNVEPQRKWWQPAPE
ncbi:hypothetical protein FE634_19730 [Nocardioides dongxiaopingii]|uniref:hypothetical protein n=1 Tax=Nocardioides sp. S-1144 TaxID=2582905 RepID=UPI00110D4B84|nr:hypothetical protein [Nocardioides sp. S-1144]QCW52087.1 hypothetical protein FE634_19730 [Nocardioides sp. S-1144]